MQIEKKQKIIYFVTKGVWGGAQKYVYNLATNLDKNRYEPVVVCGDGNILRERLEAFGIRVIEINNLKRDISFFDELKNFFTFYKIIKKEKPDVIHLNSPKASGLGALAGRILCVRKIIFTAHGWTFNEDRGALNKSLVWFLSWVTVMLSHKVIVIANPEKLQALKMPFVSKNEIELIHNGIEKIDFIERYEARKNLVSSISENYEGTVWIGTMAELHKNKSHSHLITALSKINHPFVFVIIGEGEERKNLEKLISTYRLEEKVFLVGFKEKASQYLKAFDIFTLTSKKEGLPYAILEAGLASLPVVATNVGGIGDIIEDHKNGLLIKPHNIHQTRDGIEYLIENIEKRTEFGQNLKEKVEKEFSIEKMLEKTNQLYN